MIGVIVVPGHDAEGLYEHTPMPLLPLGDRPVLQHIIELLAHQGIRRFELILEDAPEQIEHYLGDGTRWGCRFRYHLVSQPGRPYRLLPIILASGVDPEPCLLVHADQVPYVSFPDHLDDSRPVLFFEGEEGGWLGAVILPEGRLPDSVLRGSKADLDVHIESLVETGSAKIVRVPHSLNVKTPLALLRSQRELLDRTLGDLMIGGNENEPGVWISRNVVIHPSAQLFPPVYLGPNCRIGKRVRVGPHAVISGNCIVDAQTIVQNALITAGSYVGEHLEVCDSIVSRNLLVNANLDTAITIHESFLLGNLTGGNHRSGLAQAIEAVIAILLIALFSPLLLAVWIYLRISRRGVFTSIEVVKLPSAEAPQLWRLYRLPFATSVAWTEQPAVGWKSFLWRFLPGLFAVASRKLSLVGLPPRTRAEVLALPKDWQSLYLSGKAGLISEAALLGSRSGTDAYLVDACYCAMRGPKHDLHLFGQYFLALLAGSRTDAAADEMRAEE